MVALQTSESRPKTRSRTAACAVPRDGYGGMSIHLAGTSVIKDLAASLDVSPRRSLCRAFKRNLGMPARVWIDTDASISLKGLHAHDGGLTKGDLPCLRHERIMRISPVRSGAIVPRDALSCDTRTMAPLRKKLVSLTARCEDIGTRMTGEGFRAA